MIIMLTTTGTSTLVGDGVVITTLGTRVDITDGIILGTILGIVDGMAGDGLITEADGTALGTTLGITTVVTTDGIILLIMEVDTITDIMPVIPKMEEEVLIIPTDKGEEQLTTVAIL